MSVLHRHKQGGGVISSPKVPQLPPQSHSFHKPRGMAVSAMYHCGLRPKGADGLAPASSPWPLQKNITVLSPTPSPGLPAGPSQKSKNICHQLSVIWAVTPDLESCYNHLLPRDLLPRLAKQTLIMSLLFLPSIFSGSQIPSQQAEWTKMDVRGEGSQVH